MGNRVLLVEGEDDQHVMWNVFEVRKMPDVSKVRRPNEDRVSEGRGYESGGDTVLLDAIPRWLLRTDLERLAVVMDANGRGPNARWDSIRGRLVNAGYQHIPEKLPARGVVFELSPSPRTPRPIRFGAWIMPDNRSPGMLEDFVAGLIRAGDAMLARVDQFLGAIPADQRRFVPARHPKARIHSWLALSERPGRPMGQAVKAEKYIDAHHPSVQPFLDWVQRALVD
jgi:hypothetical protein